jgi:hypothetical protein
MKQSKNGLERTLTKRTPNTFVVIVAVGTTTTEMSGSRDTQREHPILPGAVGAFWVVNPARNLGKVGFDVGVPGETGDAAGASCGVPGGGQGSQSSHGAGGTRRQGRNRRC